MFFLMTTFFTEVRQTLVPRGEVKHGPLPPLLVAMTLVTGLVDAFSYLVLGHVFVANMTGNVVFLAFALAGASGFSILASLVALCSFVLGSLLYTFLAPEKALLFMLVTHLSPQKVRRSVSCRDPRVKPSHADRRGQRRFCQSHSRTMRGTFTPETHIVLLAQS